jgi:hypothetical protein
MLAYAGLLLLPVHILEFSWRKGFAEMGVTFAVILTLGLSIISSAIWNAYLKGTSGAGYGWIGMGLVVVVAVALDEIRTVIGRFPTGTHEERLMHAALVLWVTLVAFATKTPWDDLRDKLTAEIRQRSEPSVPKS